MGRRKKEEVIPTTTYDENRSYVQRALENLTVSQVHFTDRDIIQRRTVEYFSRCDNIGVKPCLVGLYNHLGVTKATFDKWRRGTSGDEWIKEYAQRVQQLFEELTVTYMQEGQIFAPAAMFMLKCNFGYEEQPKIQAESSTQRVSYDVVSDDILSLASGARKQLSASYESTDKKAEEP